MNDRIDSEQRWITMTSCQRKYNSQLSINIFVKKRVCSLLDSSSTKTATFFNLLIILDDESDILGGEWFIILSRSDRRSVINSFGRFKIQFLIFIFL